jgi:deoxyhypusine synthase
VEDALASSKAHILSNPTRPFDPVGATTASEILTRMQGTAFQGKQLGLAFEVWKKMLGDRCTIMMGMSGAMVPAGMRRLVVRMIENRLIDCLVSTGANFFHDLHETLGNFHYQGSAATDDVLLAENLIDRMYDVLADEEKFREHDQWIGRFAASLDQSRPYTTRVSVPARQRASETLQGRWHRFRGSQSRHPAVLPGHRRQLHRNRHRGQSLRGR